MLLRIATFNVQGLFHQWSGSTSLDREHTQTLTGLRYEGPSIRRRQHAETAILARRIADIDADVVCLQQVESAGALAAFLSQAPEDEPLAHAYPWWTVLGGNDPRLASLAVVSRMPLGGVTSWRHLQNPATGSLCLRRDLLEVQVLSSDAEWSVMTLFNVHLADPLFDSTLGPTRQAEARTIHDVLVERAGRRSSYLLLGTVGCGPAAEELIPWRNGTLELVDALAHAKETRPFERDSGPSHTRWTVRYESSAGGIRYEAWDHVWASKSLAHRITAALIERRVNPEGDASSHDPAFVTVDFRGQAEHDVGVRRASVPHKSIRRRRPKRRSAASFRSMRAESANPSPPPLPRWP